MLVSVYTGEFALFSSGYSAGISTGKTESCSLNKGKEIG